MASVPRQMLFHKRNITCILLPTLNNMQLQSTTDGRMGSGVFHFQPHRVNLLQIRNSLVTAASQATKSPRPSGGRHQCCMLVRVYLHPPTQRILPVGLDPPGHTFLERETITALDLFTGNTPRVPVRVDYIISGSLYVLLHEFMSFSGLIPSMQLRSGLGVSQRVELRG